MKVAQHFRAFLEMHHYLHLPAIGRFRVLSKDTNVQDKRQADDLLQFTPDKSAGADAELVSYVSQKMKVEKCIAESDLVSFSQVTRELLIQGLEVEIPGVGFLRKEKADHMIFSSTCIYKNIPVKKRFPTVATPTFW